MTVQQLKERIRHLAGHNEVVFFPEGSIEDGEGNNLMAGIGYFDLEEKDYVYLGDIVVLDDEED